MAKKSKKNENLTLEEKLEQALIPNWDEPHKLPDNWCWVRIDSIASIYTGNSINERVKKEKYTGKTQGLVYLATKDIGFDSIIDYETNVCIPEEDGFKIAPKYSTLLCIEGGSAGRKVGFITQDVCFVNKLCAFVPKSKINHKYLYYAIQSNAFKSQFDAKKHGLIGGVSVKEVSAIYVPMAPYEQQNRIVEHIENLIAKLDEAKEKAQEVIDSFENRKAAILHKAFSGELTVKWREENRKNFNDWQKTKLKECSSKIGDGLHGTPQYTEGESYYFVNGNNFSGETIEIKPDTKTVNKKEYEKYFIELSRDKTVFVSINGTLGKTAFYNGERIILGKSACYVNVSDILNKFYLRFYFTSKEFLDYANTMATGSTIKNLGLKAIRELPLLLPSLEEQKEIVRILDEISTKELYVKETAEKVISQIDIMKKAILARAFRGELGTNNPDEESAVELLKQIIKNEENT